ncbi:PepSY-associated TM helix domain-containing protein [Cellulomonas iranensis]|uniref:Iron-regulated membrane protein n=1 Tax=Cellulomonas iranensis TaxID=76862 RepID=A0ABU0GJV4_9CELL|nr:PepSY-associated TM helix domain-containing protein [Cellulomonas iranensis]MDQ0425622.1 putative iron-regulated membrane protein [Cellulomonas iranensis]
MTTPTAPGRTLPAATTTSPPRARRRWLGPLLLRLHFYAGVFVGPFIVVAAISGGLYALTPQIERVVYAHELTAASPDAAALPLADQVVAAREHVGQGETLVAVRPAPEPGATTRVMFAGTDLGPSETRAVFVDPGTAEVRGELTTYGTSGALPLRTWIDQLHRSLHLGDPGRLYSELAASWLGIIALSGLAMWVVQFRRTRRRRDMLRPGTGRTPYARSRSRHLAVGIWVMAGALFLSATGITWSQYGGANVTDLRGALGWSTPAVSTALDGGGDGAGDEHAGHTTAGTPSVSSGTYAPGAFDSVLSVAQEVNVNTGLVEIRPPAEPGTAWVVQEIQRSYPTEVDAVAIDGTTMQVTDRVDFAEFGLIAKLARWGIDLHMGSMFGLPHQIVLFVLASGIVSMVVWGYTMWWQRRPTRTQHRPGAPPARGVLRQVPWWGAVAVIAVAAAVGLFLPLLGVTLAAFLLVDLLLAWVARRRDSSRRRASPARADAHGA